MTKLDAVRAIIADGQNETISRPKLNKLRKAMAALELTAEDQIEVECDLEYRRLGTKELYSFLLTDKEKAAGV